MWKTPKNLTSINFIIQLIVYNLINLYTNQFYGKAKKE